MKPRLSPCAAALLFLAGAPFVATAAPTPAGGTLSPATPTLTFTGGFAVSDPSGASCGAPASPSCDSYSLTVELPADYAATNPNARIRVSLAFDDIDYDLYIYDEAFDEVTNSAGSSNPEVAIFDAGSGTASYTVDVLGWTASGGTYETTITLIPGASALDADGDGVGDADDLCAGTPAGTPVDADGCPLPDADGDGVADENDLCAGTPPGTLVDTDGCPVPPPPPDLPRYRNFQAPPGAGTDSGEPSIGCNWQSEQVFSNTNVDGTTNDLPNGGTSNYFGGFLPYMLRATFDDCASPAYVTWDEKALVLASTPRALGDPILFTDRDTGRTWVIQLEPGAGATIDVTDDDGETFTPTTGPVASGNDFDHETIASGPYHEPLDGINPLYPHAVYYASQGVSEAVVLRSDDGGITYNAKIPMWTAAQCTGLHGHLKVAHDGTVYIPPRACALPGGGPPLLFNGNAAAVVSEDNGLTWDIRPITHPSGASVQDDDPSIGVATDGTIYLGFHGPDGHPRISVSKDKGLTWSVPFDISDTVINGGPIENLAFPEVVAGDPDRAAFSFFGTERAGPDWDQPNFAGVWYLYIATTFDGGQTWTTQNVTPGDPIQRGGICGDGTCRNLLDFYDITVDKQGRVLVAGEDGCISTSCINGSSYQDNDFTAKAFITRQSGGKRLFAAYDPPELGLPGAPQLSGGLNADKTVANLTWSVPDNAGSVIAAYNVYHRAGPSGPFSKIATVTTTNYSDPTYDDSVQNFYHVTAVNEVGEGPYCRDFTPAFVIAPNPCTLPGILALDDLSADGSDEDSGQNTPADPAVNIRQLFVAELDNGADPDQLTFTLQVAPSTRTTAPPNSEWYVVWNRRTVAADGSDRAYVAMKSDPTGAVSFEYGDFGPPLPLDGSIPPPNANTPTRVGDADGGSYDATAGIITIVLANSKAEDAQAGDTLAGLNVRTYLARSEPGQRSQNNASDISPDGSYTLAGSAACALNTPPTALLIGFPSSGAVPLAVTFDLSGSSESDDGDFIKTYYLRFGDDTSVVLTEPPLTVDHVYTLPGTYTATLTAEDSRGASSVASAANQFTVTVLDPNAALGDVGNTRLGGALPPALLALLALAGLAGLARRWHCRPAGVN